MALFELGNFQFISLTRLDLPDAPPLQLSEQTEITQRPGVDGTGVLRYGRKGRPFQMASAVDETSFSSGNLLTELYYAAVGAGKLDLVWNGIDYRIEHGVQYVVLDLPACSVKRVRTASGGLASPSLALVRAVWTLLPVVVSSG